MNMVVVEDWLKSQSRNSWLEVGTYEVYLRKGYHSVEGKAANTLDLANVSNRSEVYGGYWAMFAGLIRLGKQYGFDYLYLENTHNARLLEAYRQRRCTIDGVNAYRRLK